MTTPTATAAAKAPAKKTIMLGKDEQQAWTNTLNTLLSDAEKKSDKGEKLVAYNSIVEHARWKLKQVQSRRAQYGSAVFKNWLLGSAGLFIAAGTVALAVSAAAVALPAVVTAGLGIATALGGVGIFATSAAKSLFLKHFDKQHKSIADTLEAGRVKAAGLEEALAAEGAKAFVDSKAAHLLERRFPELKEEFMKKVAKKAGERKAQPAPAQPAPVAATPAAAVTEQPAAPAATPKPVAETPKPA